MSQQLIPVNGGVQEIKTTTTQNRLQVLSQHYISVNKLEDQPTEWVPGGRPVYRRLPAISETYQIDFFSFSSDIGNVEKLGYVYTPWDPGEGFSNALQVSASESSQDLLIKGGVIVWEYGNTQVSPTIVNLPIVDVARGRYDLAYQLIYDDSPIQKLYQVEDFSLGGLPMTITSSTDAPIGWRYDAVNAFLNTTNLFWANKDTYFPLSAQPATSYLQWESDLPMAYSRVTLRCPSGTSHTGTATLSYYDNAVYTEVDTIGISSDAAGQFFEFTVSPRFQNGWNVTFSDVSMSIQSISVTGVVTLMEQQSSPSTRAVLVLYPSNTLPKTVITGSGKEVQATYCPLAIIETSVDYRVTSIQDARYVIHRDYVPVADWLTRPFDDSLIDLYEQVSEYPSLWMAPPTALKQEYLSLEKGQVVVEV